MSAATSSTRPPTISAPPSSRPPRASSPPRSVPSIKVTEGSGLLSDNFPMIHAVGRASDRAPRLIDLRWGAEHAPKVTIVGKGICFDTGGLDIKPGSAMALMKKDMGGAAAALAFALLVMRAKLPVRLRVLIPAAENSDRRQCLPAGRRAHQPERHDGRDRQHRRRGAARAGRRHQPRRRRGAGLSHHHRHARPARRASRSGPICRRSTPTTRTWPRVCSPPAAPWAIRYGACRSGRPTTSCSRARSPM